MSLCIFGFNSSIRRKLLDFEEGVHLSNCEIKRSRQGNDLKILVTKYTDFVKSEKQFDVSSANSDVLTELKALQNLVTFQMVAVEVKVLQVDDPLVVSGGKNKQDLIVGDSSGTTRVTEQEIAE